MKSTTMKIVLSAVGVLVGGALLFEYKKGRERHTFSRALRRNTWF